MQGDITDAAAARKLGYYIFWNLRQEHSGLAVDEGEVREAASRAGIKHVDAAWELFDRNCDSSATLEEIVASVEQTFQNRESLMHTLRDNATVVAQVEYAIGVTLFVVWLFITAAIFDAGAVQRTWTALSAGLLSFSFIFGNSIREVCPALHAALVLCCPARLQPVVHQRMIFCMVALRRAMRHSRRLRAGV
jgi:hypothetical protein